MVYMWYFEHNEIVLLIEKSYWSYARATRSANNFKHGNEFFWEPIALLQTLLENFI